MLFIVCVTEKLSGIIDKSIEHAITRHTKPSPGQPKDVGEDAMAPAMTSG